MFYIDIDIFFDTRLALIQKLYPSTFDLIVEDLKIHKLRGEMDQWPNISVDEFYAVYKQRKDHYDIFNYVKPTVKAYILRDSILKLMSSYKSVPTSNRIPSVDFNVYPYPIEILNKDNKLTEGLKTFFTVPLEINLVWKKPSELDPRYLNTKKYVYIYDFNEFLDRQHKNLFSCSMPEVNIYVARRYITTPVKDEDLKDIDLMEAFSLSLLGKVQLDFIPLDILSVVY